MIFCDRKKDPTVKYFSGFNRDLKCLYVSQSVEFNMLSWQFWNMQSLLLCLNIARNTLMSPTFYSTDLVLTKYGQTHKYKVTVSHWLPKLSYHFRQAVLTCHNSYEGYDIGASE